MTSIDGRLERLEAKYGLHVPPELRVDPLVHWGCYVRFGHTEEDFAEACRRAGLPTDLPGIVLLGEIPPDQVHAGFIPSIERIQIGAPSLMGS